MKWNIEPTKGECPDTKGLESLENKIEVEKETLWNYQKKVLSCVYEKKELKLDNNVEKMITVDNFENSGIFLEDQFQELIEKDKKTDNLSKLDRKMTQYTECAKNSKVGNIIEYINIVKAIEIVTYLFNSRGNIYLNFLFRT
ncbi:hypothetical protein F8M41_011085 [Gigaspora margarita]|uniref:Uncharacterized protein n=1 Tax=Gigaspora margarita TaxID=4874 RepID=A0A8H3X0S7_GIGMA|nr:hypothetical protein F8M41_011085 [Gigaspora margarita]